MNVFRFQFLRMTLFLHREVACRLLDPPQAVLLLANCKTREGTSPTAPTLEEFPSPSQCTIGPRESINQITSYIDASQIYGSEVAVGESLRAEKGKLLSQNNDQLLPANPDQTGCSAQTDADHSCFLAGDARNNEQIGLTSMHTMWLQEHNKIAEELAIINPHWDSHRIFLETRKIIGALHQRITYNEFLPDIIGPKFMKKYKLTEETGRKYFDKYDRRCDATIVTELATAAFRFGHTLVDTVFNVNTPGQLETTFDLAENFFNPNLLYKNPKNAHGILAGFANQSNLKLDRLVHNTLRNRLFEISGSRAFDLAALNIQRGRDHGIPSYANFRQKFKLPPISEFAQLRWIMASDTVKALRKVYESVKDIDLWTGIVSEIPKNQGGIIGETGAKILAYQFKNLKFCDRYFYSNHPKTNPGAFSREQLAEIRKMKLSNIICHNSPESEIQENVMQTAGVDNERKSCASYANLNLSKWKENPSASHRKENFVKHDIYPVRCIPEKDGTNDFGVKFKKDIFDD